MRSGASIEAIQAAFGSRAYMYLEFTDYAGAWKNYTALPFASRVLDFVNAASLRDGIDGNTWSATFTLARDIGVASLSPFRTDSALNDSGSGFQPALDLHRRWRLWIAAPTNLEFRELARGWTDKITISGDPAIITVEARGEEAELIDSRILFVDPAADPPVMISSTNPKVYASGTHDEVIQAILDDYLGPGVVTLTVDASVTPFFVNGWNQETDVGLFDLITTVAALAGDRVRYRYDASDNLTLTLFKPRRTATVPDWTTSARSYKRLDARLDKAGIRNFIVGQYVDETFGEQTVTSPVTPPYPPVSASIARYGLRPLAFSLAAQTQVVTQAAMGELTDAILSDLEFPPIDQDLTEFGLWFAELWDYIRTDANGVHYDEDQFGGVTSIEHNFSNGMLETTLGLSAKVVGMYRKWLSFGTGAPRVPFTPQVTNVQATWQEQLTGDAYRTGVIATATVSRYTQSVKFELSETVDFAVVIGTSYADVIDSVATTGWFGSLLVTPGTTYYVRATAFSGPLETPAPTGPSTGVEGEFLVGNTGNPASPEDTDTVTWTLDEPGKWKANVVTDSGSSSAASKGYVDAKLAGLSWKQGVRAATTGAGTLASSFENGDTIDGVALATGDRILIKDQAAPSENGIYVVNASGAPTRATDADAAAELVNATCYVSEGTTNADTQWTCTTNAPITLGSTSLAFAQLSTGGSSPAATTVVLTSASLADGATETGSIAVAKSALLQKLVVSAACWLRLYETSAARTSDASRAITTSPKAGLGILSNAAPGLDSAGLTIPISPAHELHNGDGPRTTTIYYALTNKSGSTAAITATLTILPLES